jgi:NADPH:quinone reductase-like Zn-dependent oxidoreductase
MPEVSCADQAASVPLAGLTAWQALVTKGNIKEGDNVLVYASIASAPLATSKPA